MPAIESIKVLVIQQVPDQALDRIANVDQRIKVIDARGWFDVELRATWPQWTVDRYLASRKYPATTGDQRNQALASAEIILVGWPPVKRHPRSRASTEMGPRATCGSEQFSRYRSVGLGCYRNDFPRADE